MVINAMNLENDDEPIVTMAVLAMMDDTLMIPVMVKNKMMVVVAATITVTITSIVLDLLLLLSA